LRERCESCVVACCRDWHRMVGREGIATNVGGFVELDPCVEVAAICG
jgi:hypothetical protein